MWWLDDLFCSLLTLVCNAGNHCFTARCAFFCAYTMSFPPFFFLAHFACRTSWSLHHVHPQCRPFSTTSSTPYRPLTSFSLNPNPSIHYYPLHLHANSAGRTRFFLLLCMSSELCNWFTSFTISRLSTLHESWKTMARDPYALLTLENVFRVEIQIYFAIRFIATGKTKRSRSKPKRESRGVKGVVW